MLLELNVYVPNHNIAYLSPAPSVTKTGNDFSPDTSLLLKRKCFNYNAGNIDINYEIWNNNLCGIILIKTVLHRFNKCRKYFS